MRNMTIISTLILLLTVFGCTPLNHSPKEQRLSLKLKGSNEEIQSIIEDLFITDYSHYNIDTVTDRTITFKALCASMPNKNPFSCTMIMMTVGNSSWDGPFSIFTFNTTNVNGISHVTANHKWCAVNTFGKVNCMQAGNNEDTNRLLREIESSYKKLNGMVD